MLYEVITQLDEAQRQWLGETAVRAALAVGYQNAGTVEFLQARDGHFYFMEMNTRLQVEHTVSEAITGIDIVQEQFRIAAGQPLAYRQDQIQRRGYAMELRIVITSYSIHYTKLYESKASPTV